jgi:hypothetical protein
MPDRGVRGLVEGFLAGTGARPHTPQAVTGASNPAQLKIF